MDKYEIQNLANSLGEKEQRLIRLHASYAAFKELNKMIQGNQSLEQIKKHVSKQINTIGDRIELIKGNNLPIDDGTCKHEYLLHESEMGSEYSYFSPCIHCGHIPESEKDRHRRIYEDL